MAERNSYIVTKTLNSYLKGSVIIAIAGHLVTTTDAVIVSWLLGQKAFTAVNAIIPILTFFSALMIMLSTGVSVSISKALGNRNMEKVNLASSSTITGAFVFGILVAVLPYHFCDIIVKTLVHHDDVIFHFALHYLKTFCYAVPFLILAGVTSSIVRTDGNTTLIRIAVWIGIIANVILDIVFVGFLNFGISGAAWATGVNYLIVFIIGLSHFLSKNNTIKWSYDIKKYIGYIKEDCKLGFSTSLTDLLLAVSLFLINGIMVRYIGNEGIYCWAVCYQILLILQMILSGVDSGIFSLGGTLLEEDDVKGLNFLYKRSAIYLVSGMVLLISSIIFFPEFYGSVFGNTGDDRFRLLPFVLKSFSLMLFPYGMIMQVRSIYTVLGRGSLSIFLCIFTFGLMILFIYVSARINIEYIWWSVPISSWLLFIGLIIYTAILHIRNKNLRILTLIPESIADPMYNVSVDLNLESTKDFENEISGFLNKNKINENYVKFIVSITDKLIEAIKENIVLNHKKSFFDFNLRIKENKVIEILKFNSKRIEEDKEKSLISVLTEEGKEAGSNSENNNVSQDFSTSYYYMNDQNTFTLVF